MTPKREKKKSGLNKGSTREKGGIIADKSSSLGNDYRRRWVQANSLSRARHTHTHTHTHTPHTPQGFYWRGKLCIKRSQFIYTNYDGWQTTSTSVKRIMQAGNRGVKKGCRDISELSVKSITNLRLWSLIHGLFFFSSNQGLEANRHHLL